MIEQVHAARQEALPDHEARETLSLYHADLESRLVDQRRGQGSSGSCADDDYLVVDWLTPVLTYR